MYVKPKKALGQHFLKDNKIAERIVKALVSPETTPVTDPETAAVPATNQVLEIGPGTGVLTAFLVKEQGIDFKLIEIDDESVRYLREYYPQLGDSLIEGDFLRMDLEALFPGKFMIIGNFPYNISSQIFFKVLDHREKIPTVVGMLQKEVAQRLASPPGNKDYGILSVLLQAWYNIEYLFTVDENSFIPPPKVKSAVIRITANDRKELGCDEVLFKKVIKATFNQRRKTIRNSIKSLLSTLDTTGKAYEALCRARTPLLAKRPEQLSVEEFVELTLIVSSCITLS
ncbi:MAG: 16S rRNA (adenine(1518)-N(6)/adenine(1519)-N(6))-dimethyltransferase RsmA [Rikenellaceae bacterium]|nr:16S rRNA (adenine(1518)-N(6)/adenine(1519)-N(6))-dimethyltransferase RsmA [Rikenellaceae bacterium]